MDHRENDDIVDTEFLQNQQQRIVPIVVLWTLLRIKNVLSFFCVFFQFYRNVMEFPQDQMPFLLLLMEFLRHDEKELVLFVIFDRNSTGSQAARFFFFPQLSSVLHFAGKQTQRSGHTTAPFRPK